MKAASLNNMRVGPIFLVGIRHLVEQLPRFFLDRHHNDPLVVRTIVCTVEAYSCTYAKALSKMQTCR